jgi:hypothetical protein
MSDTTSKDADLEETRRLEAGIAEMFAEMDRLREIMRNDQVEIERLKAETEVIKAETEVIKAESRALMAKTRILLSSLGNAA